MKICLNQTVNKTESCINHTFNKVPLQEIFVTITCINWTPVYSERGIHLPDLPSWVTCSVTSTCNSIECCVDLPRLNKSVTVGMVIENCRNTLLLNIGHQRTKIKLNEFQFGKYIIFVHVIWFDYYVSPSNDLTLRSKVKVSRRSLWYVTYRLMVMHPHTKYNWPIWKDKKVMVRTSFAEKKISLLNRKYVYY
jgi:hypothetical protein